RSYGDWSSDVCSSDLAPYGPSVSAATKTAIAKKMQQIESGSFYEFTGPLYDQKGKLRVPSGKRLTVKDLYAMNWLVRGVIGSARSEERRVGKECRARG